MHDKNRAYWLRSAGAWCKNNLRQHRKKVINISNESAHKELRLHAVECACGAFPGQISPHCATQYLPSLKRRRCITLSFMGVALIARGRGHHVPPLLIRSLGALPAVAGPVQRER